MSDINKTGYVYLLASKTVGTTYLGVTSELIKRVAEHKAGVYKGFSYKHGVHKLVYYQECGSIEAAIALEKKMKKWRRFRKIEAGLWIKSGMMAWLAQIKGLPTIPAGLYI